MSNVDKHPGLPDAPAKQWTHSERLADDAQRMEVQEMQHNKALLTLVTIASVEEEMEVTQSAKQVATKSGIPSQEKSKRKGQCCCC